jgi:tRNA threonylcarbamoyladenosine biosynthesis protein TsaE
MSQPFLTRSEEETLALGHRLGLELSPGTWVLLLGDLGAGKTVFVRGLARALGVNPDEVTSPTFVLVQEYAGDVKLFHVDLYRVDGTRAIEDLGLDDLAGAEPSIVAIEWAEKLPDPLERAVRVTIEDAGEEARRISIEAPFDPELATRIDSWAPPW